MKTLELYKFVTEHNIEYHWNNDDVIMFVDNYLINEWNQLLESGITYDDGGIECRMKDGYLCFDMKNICEYFGIELNNVFTKQNWDE